MEEKHIMVSLGDKNAKEIGEIIGNKTCSRILEFLASEDGTVTDISNALKIPLNTADYNVKKLVSAGLIEKSSHWWSVKGKKMPVYRVSNRKIIISPRKSVAKVFAWVIGLTGLSALTLRQFMGSGVKLGNDVAEGGTYASDMVPLVGLEPTGFWASISPWSWFLIGAWFAVVLFFVITLYTERRSKGPSFKFCHSEKYERRRNK